MNHHGTLDAQYNGHRRRPRGNGAPAEADPQPFNAFGAPGSRRHPLNTAAAAAAADSQRSATQRSAADDFWATNQGWTESQGGFAGGEPAPYTGAEPDAPQTVAWTGQEAGWSQPAPEPWPNPQPAPAPWPDQHRYGEESWDRDNKPAWHSDPNWNTHQSWSEAQVWAEEPAPGSDTPERRPATIAEALAESPAEPETDEPARTGRSRGAHRVAAPPSALKGRAAVVAVAAGAVVAAGQCATAATGEQKPAGQAASDYEAAGSVHEIAAQSMATEDPSTAAPVDTGTRSPQMLSGIAAPLETERFGEMLANGAEFAQNLARAEEAKYRPLFASFASGTYTSGYGARWGVQHLGIDIAGPIGTPIYAVADGEVIDAGPASGFGMWVRLLHADGTITVYGHVDTTTVSVGEYVLAGDQIATMGNRGFSTGPHCHFEVWLDGNNKIDPIPWLATRGIGLVGSGD